MLVLRRRRSGTRLYQRHFVLKYQFLFLGVRDGERIRFKVYVIRYEELFRVPHVWPQATKAARLCSYQETSMNFDFVPKLWTR